MVRHDHVNYMTGLGRRKLYLYICGISMARKSHTPSAEAPGPEYPSPDCSVASPFYPGSSLRLLLPASLTFAHTVPLPGVLTPHSPGQQVTNPTVTLVPSQRVL